MHNLILASSSPRRRELLEQLSLRFDVVVADIDETPLHEEPAQDYVARMSRSKARSVAESLTDLPISSEREAYVIAADTIGVLDERILIKPEDQADFTAMMEAMSGRMHQVITSVCVAGWSRSNGWRYREKSVVTEVLFKTLSQYEIEAYWRTGEPLDKAGGYGIQSKGALLVERLSGSYSNVVGLPLRETAELLQKLGCDVWKAMQT
ncbi:MAG: Maf family protein [Oleiphilaceae bacterium]|nr:Maf family protein [Oleiphilaceae bacterium]